jgi:hypothetical protein
LLSPLLLLGFLLFAGVPLVPEVLIVAGFPGVVSVSSVVFAFDVAGVHDVVDILAVAGVFSVASIPADPGNPLLTSVITYCTVQCTVHCTFCTIGHVRLSVFGYETVIFSAIGLSEYRILDWGNLEKLTDYRISDQGLNLTDYQISDLQKTIGCPPLEIT